MRQHYRVCVSGASQPLPTTRFFAEVPVMGGDHIVVRNVRGRYPQGGKRLRPENVEAEVTAETRLVTVRVEDAGHPEFWLEIMLEVEAAFA